MYVRYYMHLSVHKPSLVFDALNLKTELSLATEALS